METKKILVEKTERNIVESAMANSENEKLDILSFVVGGVLKGSGGSTLCDQPPDYRAFADSTYVKR